VRPGEWDRPDWLTDAERSVCTGARRREKVAARAAAKALLLDYLEVDTDTASPTQIEWIADERGRPHPSFDAALQARIAVAPADLRVSWSHTEELVTILIARRS
jgi:phosphopantetheinyl transferase (holo-ACP synthase)